MSAIHESDEGRLSVFLVKPSKWRNLNDLYVHIQLYGSLRPESMQFVARVYGRLRRPSNSIQNQSFTRRQPPHYFGWCQSQASTNEEGDVNYLRYDLYTFVKEKPTKEGILNEEEELITAVRTSCVFASLSLSRFYCLCVCVFHSPYLYTHLVSLTLCMSVSACLAHYIYVRPSFSVSVSLHLYRRLWLSAFVILRRCLFTAYDLSLSASVTAYRSLSVSCDLSNHVCLL